MRWKKFWIRFAIVVLVVMVALGASYLILDVEKNQLDLDARRQAPGEFIQLPSGDVHYQLVGPADGPLLVLVHGFSVPSYVWEPTVQALGEAGYQVLIYDLFGRGYSERIKGDYDIDLFTRQLEELVSALEVEGTIAVGGLSMGGPIAARFAHLHPEQVERVILIAPEVVQTTSGDIFPLNLPLFGEYLMTAVMEPFVLPKLQVADLHHPDNFPGWEDKYRVQLQYQGTGAALLSTIRNLTEHDPEEEYRALERTGVPVLLIWGEGDQIMGWEQMEILDEILSNLEVEIIPDAGHLPHYEQPGLVNPLLIEFLHK